MQEDSKMHVGCWIQQITTRIGAVTCWIQQPVPPKQVVGFTFVFNSEVDQLTGKLIVHTEPIPAVIYKAFIHALAKARKSMYAEEWLRKILDARGLDKIRKKRKIF